MIQLWEELYQQAISVGMTEKQAIKWADEMLIDCQATINDMVKSRSRGEL